MAMTDNRKQGLDFRDNSIHLFSEEISKILGIPCSALSGANLAAEVAQEKYGETTIATKNVAKEGQIFYKVKLSLKTKQHFSDLALSVHSSFIQII